MGLSKRTRVPTPGPRELYALCELLARSPKEEELQVYLQSNPGFLAGLTGTPDNTDLAVLFKPKIGTQFVADFCVLQSYQGGSVANLIELETSDDQLFTKNGNPARRYATALKQVEDWRIWIDRNKVHFAKELVRTAKALPLISAKAPRLKGIRTTDAARLEKIWAAFGGFDEPFYNYTIVLGRWSRLRGSDKTRIIARNRNTDRDLTTYTYEQLARQANFRLERDEW